jgi:hypothetical protein
MQLASPEYFILLALVFFAYWFARSWNAPLTVPALLVTTDRPHKVFQSIAPRAVRQSRCFLCSRVLSSGVAAV